MSETKFTPGPWRTSGEIDARYLSGIGDVILVRRNAERDDRYVAITTLDGMGDNGPATTPQERAANAHLIAAAPELFEALNEAINYVAGHAAVFKDEDASRFLDKCTAALSKARGEQP